MAFISPTCTIGDSSTLWHKRLGHANMEVILKLISMSLFRDLPKLDSINHSCNTCKLGNQVHASLKTNFNKTSSLRILELLHIGLFGPSTTQSIEGNFTLIVMDDFSRYTWLQFLKSENEIFEKFKTLIKGIQIFHKCHIASIQTSHGRNSHKSVQLGKF